MAKQTKTYNIVNDKNEVLRQITIEVEGGKGWHKRAAEEATKQLAAGEIALEVPLGDAKTKFTFEFEIYHNGVQKRVEEVSVLSEDEGEALEKAVDALKMELSADETYRYTNKFRKEPAKQ
ncbi:hypothetical protein [Zoogloea sp.]|uniref:hypothetical protein n=1 Tax=Zoogloea sp. TaxID=49181 RepID=UPI0014166F66|nr:MAG: hypothetical protein F9K15_12830 [Zoogloea sp.]